MLEVTPDEALLEVAPLLADPETPARAAAVEALTNLGGAGAEALIRFKACAGDDEPAIVEACFAGVLSLNPDSLPFVVQFLDSGPWEVAGAAAFALGESRIAQAFGPLRAWWERTPDRQAMAIVAMAALRLEEATAFLLTLAETESLPTARVIIEALGNQAAFDEDLRDTLLSVVERRGDARLLDMARHASRRKG